MLNAGTVVSRGEINITPFRQGMNQMHRQGMQGTAQIDKGFKGLGNTLMSLRGLMVTGFGAAIIATSRNAVREFAQLEGALAKFNVVFGAQSQEMRAWVDEFRKGVPLATREIIAASASMQDLLVPMGIARDQATGMTQEWMQLAAALAAFNDVPVDQALEAIRSGIAGQSRPLRQFGIDARESAIQQTALAEGLIKSGETMSEQVRQQALLIHSYKQSTDAVDGYEDQLGSTLMKEQGLAASFKDTASVIGQALQPGYNRLTDALTKFLDVTGAMFGRVHNDLRRTHELIDFAFGNEATIKSFQMALKAVSDMIALTEQEIDASGGATEELTKRLDDLTRSAVELAAGMAHLAMQPIIPEDATDNVESARKTVGSLQDKIKELEESISKSFDRTAIIAFQDQIHITENSIRSLMGTLKPDTPIADVFYDLEQALLDVDDTMRSSLLFGGGSEILIPEGSLMDLRAQVRALNDELEVTTNPERQEFLRQQIEGLNTAIGEVTNGIQNAGGASLFFTRSLADGLEGILFQARSVEDAIKGIIRQLASRAFIVGIGALLTGGASLGTSSFIGAMFGGSRHSGGVVPGVGDRQMTLKGGESVLTSGQMKALGGMVNRPSGISAVAMERAFDRALSKHLSTLRPNEFAVLTAEGNRFEERLR